MVSSMEVHASGRNPPVISAERVLAFRDAEGAAQWLAGQPQANPPAMLSSLDLQLKSFDQLDVSSRQRFRILEVLRKAVFAAAAAGQHHSAGKPLPLTTDEQAALDSVRRLWRACALEYRRCLQASLEGDSSLDGHSARVAHRAAACLRMEQLAGYASGASLMAGFWKSLHTVYHLGEQLGCGEEIVTDRWPGDDHGMSLNAQYAMSLMLHLVQPFSMTSAHLAIAERWLARWREMAKVTALAPTATVFSSWWIDLDQDSPLHEGSGEASLPRWLLLDAVGKKIRGRRAALQAGASPESLKLGNHLSAAGSLALLETLDRHLRQTPPAWSIERADMPELMLGVGLRTVYRLLGGRDLDEVSHTSSFMGDHLLKEQLAIFGHVVRESRPSPLASMERWRLEHREGRLLRLLRAPGDGVSRLSHQTLLAIARHEAFLLALVTGIGQSGDGTLCCSARLLSDGVAPRGVEIRDRITGRLERHPALLLNGLEGYASSELLLMPAGIMARASGVNHLDADGNPVSGMRVGECLQHGSEIDFWLVVRVD